MVIKSTDDTRLVRKTRFSAGYDVLLDREVLESLRNLKLFSGILTRLKYE